MAKVGNVADAMTKAKFRKRDTTDQGERRLCVHGSGGEVKPNAFGLYDMHGNAWQCCSDWYDADYYAASPTDDPDRAGLWQFPCPSGRFLVRRPEQHPFRPTQSGLPWRPDRRFRLPRCQD